MTSNPLAKASCAVARMQTFVFTPAMTTRSILCSRRKSARSVAKKALYRRLAQTISRGPSGVEAVDECGVGIADQVVPRKFAPLVVVEAGIVPLDRVHDDAPARPGGGQQAAQRIEHFGRARIMVRHADDKKRVDDVDQDQSRCRVGELRVGKGRQSLLSRAARQSATPRPVNTRMTMA